jgi:spermidine synthase
VALALFAVGFSAVAGQILLMRELVATFYGNELLLGMLLAAWLAWGAVGSAVATRWRRIEIPVVAVGLTLIGVVLPCQMALVRGARPLLGVTRGALVGFPTTVVVMALVPAPLCVLLGATFTTGARLLDRPGAGARAYVWESAGSVIGGLLFSFVLVRWLNPFQVALLVASLDLAVALYVLRPAWGLELAGGALLVAVLVALPLGRVLHRATLRWQWPDLVFAADSPYGRLSVVARGGQRSFFENGALAFQTESTFPEEVVHFPMLAHQDPDSLLLVGGGAGGDLFQALRHPVSRVVYVELDPTVIEAARAYLPSEQAAVLDDPRVETVLTDGRRYVQTTDDAFDVIILDLAEPSTGALNRFYTHEFFREIRSILTPGGIFSLALPSAENYWSPELARRNGSIYWTLRMVFPHVLVLPGEHNILLASDQPLPTTAAPLVARMAARDIDPAWVTPAYVDYVFTTDRFAQVGRELEDMSAVRRNRDRRPICYYYTLTLWLSRFYPGLRPVFEGSARAGLLWPLIPLALLVALGRWRRRWKMPLVIAAVGLVQMVLEVVILFAFQIDHGTLYGRVSLVVTAFMGGLVAGALLGRRVPARLARAVLSGIVAGIGGLAAVLAMVPPELAEPLYYLLALISGGLAGVAFPLAVSLETGSEGQAAGRLYAADLAGGCLGALVTAAVLIPLLGLGQTAVAAALVALAALLMLL